jgi:hypothetical protein
MQLELTHTPCCPGSTQTPLMQNLHPEFAHVLPRHRERKTPSAAMLLRHHCWSHHHFCPTVSLLEISTSMTKNRNDKSETIIKNRLLWWIFWFCHRSLVTILEPPIYNEIGYHKKNVIEQHMVSSQITHATVPAHLWWSYLELWWPWLRHWTVHG